MSECGCVSVCTDKYVYAPLRLVCVMSVCFRVHVRVACVSESACVCMICVLANDYDCLWCYFMVIVIQVVVITFTHEYVRACVSA